MAQYTPNMKYCGTCDYWGGPRETDYLGQRVYINSPMDKGRCLCQASGRVHSPGTQATGICNCWKKWAALR